MIKNPRWAIASVTGVSHIKADTERQDWSRSMLVESKTGKIIFSVVSDGAGSAKMGRQGAALICYSLSQNIREHFKTSTSMPSDEEIWTWIDGSRDLISDCAHRKQVERREFSATLVATIISATEVIALHIGDGAIVARKLGDQQWTALSWPESGEYASTTYFLIDDPSPKLRISRFRNDFSAFALFSDGIENLALNFKENCPHPPFFNSIIRAVDESTTLKNIKSLSNALADFLNSEKINERTDDDKSLIIISTK